MRKCTESGWAHSIYLYTLSFNVQSTIHLITFHAVVLHSKLFCIISNQTLLPKNNRFINL